MNQTPTRGPAKLAVTPMFYKVRDQLIPGKLTIAQRETFVQGLGVPRPQAAVFAMQDRASSLAGQLAGLIERSGDPLLVAKAEELIARWNDECDAFFRVR
jgi:hypothetical protein